LLSEQTQTQFFWNKHVDDPSAARDKATVVPKAQVDSACDIYSSFCWQNARRSYTWETQKMQNVYHQRQDDNMATMEESKGRKQQGSKALRGMLLGQRTERHQCTIWGGKQKGWDAKKIAFG
jgi:hypothetical protein